MKKLIALLLVMAMMLSAVLTLVSCGKKGNGDDTTASTTGDSGTVETPKDYRDEGFYTYNDYIGGTTGLNWNPHAWETSDDSYVLGWLSMGFYNFIPNETLDGYDIVPEMAEKLPEDVTADYVGKFGVAEGETGKAWKIALNKNACWNDGTKITADDYIYSMQEQLNPLMNNRRADSYYAGDFEVVNAKNFLYSGKKIKEQVFNGSDYTYEVSELVKAADGSYTTPDGASVYIALDTALAWLGGYSLSFYVDYYGDAYFGVEAFNSLAALADENGLVVANDASVALLTGVITAVDAWGETADDCAAYMVYDSQMPVTAWEEVGLVKVDDYTIVIVTAKPVEEPDFYMPYNLSSTWLVKKDLYESCKKYLNAEGAEVAADSADVTMITTSYCTTLETSCSYGPYNLTFYQEDKQLTFERNEKWYGYSDGAHYGQFQTDKVSCQVISDHQTALQAFLKGEIDGIGLDSTDMETYASSDRLIFTPQSYTTKLTFNTDLAALKELGNGAEILTVKEFREAFSFAINRREFATAYTAAGAAGYGLLNYNYCYNPFTGELYRNDPAAKETLVKLNGLEYGEGKEFATLDEAYDAITGFDMAKAQALMAEAATKAVADGLWDGTSTIKLDIRVYNSDEIYVKMFNYLNGQLKEACKGTVLEGKVELQMTPDEDYYNTMYAGKTAIIFSTWGGADMSPFTLLAQCYCDSSTGSGNQMEYGFDTSKITVELTVKGQKVASSLQSWANWAAGMDVDGITEKLGNYADYTYAERCAVFAELEYVYLSYFTTLPLYYRQSASLQSYKIETITKEYITLVGTGGVQFMTYNYTDAEWEAQKANIKY